MTLQHQLALSPLITKTTLAVLEVSTGFVNYQTTYTLTEYCVVNKVPSPSLLEYLCLYIQKKR